ncbi:hypothetical protein Trydic_g12131, partial [Trypoxylus dichotomus]
TTEDIARILLEAQLLYKNMWIRAAVTENHAGVIKSPLRMTYSYASPVATLLTYSSHMAKVAAPFTNSSSTGKVAAPVAVTRVSKAVVQE